jgi:hypothetical protein
MKGSSPARSMMKYRVTIERNFSVLAAKTSDTDGFGQKLGDWRELCTVPCHAWAGSSGGKHTSAGDARTVTTDMPVMIVPKGTDVATTDRVQAVRDKAGNQILPAMGIDAVLPRITHLEVRLREMS